MPELPEVETIKNTLKQLITGKRIDKVTVHWPNIIKQPDDVQQFAYMLTGQIFRDMSRKGKFLLFHLDDYTLISHLRMEGKYSVDPGDTPIKKHTHVIFALSSGEELRYNDVRKFGTMHITKKGEEFAGKPLTQLGPDPFETAFTPEYLRGKLQKTERVIKAVLLDQTIVAGLGNIYVDETLFKAGIHPLRKANKLTKKEVEAVRKEAILTLEEAVELGGTTIRSYVNSQGDMGMFQQQLFVYGKANEACPNCGRQIVKMKVSGRGTHVCLSCQRQ